LADCTVEEVCKQKFENIEVKIGNVENIFEERSKVSNHRISDLECKVDNLSLINSTLVELKILSEQNIKSNEDRDKLLRIHSESLVEVTNTLKNINKQFEETDKSIEKLDKNVGKLENKFEEINKSNNINILDLLKEGIKYLIIAGLTGVGTYFVLLSKGLIQ